VVPDTVEKLNVCSMSGERRRRFMRASNRRMNVGIFA
jgi:hypothetical protein